MNHRFPLHLLLFIFLAVISFSACKGRATVVEKKMVAKPEEINIKAEDIIQGTLKEIIQNNATFPDSLRISNAALVQSIYEHHKFRPIWTDSGQFRRTTDSLMKLIDSSLYFGLFPEDYNKQKLNRLQSDLSDTANTKHLDAAQWAYCDLLLTSTFIHWITDLSRGRLQPDSVLAKDSLLTPDFYRAKLRNFQTLPLDSFARLLEPQHPKYDSLKLGLRTFLKKARLKKLTRITSKDSAKLPLLVFRRLQEEDSTLTASSGQPDTLAIQLAIKAYQKKKGLKIDGKISPDLINVLNETDYERMLRIAVTLDKFKKLPALPEQFIWVNIPAYELYLIDSGLIKLTSRVAVGKPQTRTPQLTSVITDMVTYPKWTIPESIIKKEILPGLQRDPGYTRRKGFSVVGQDGNEIDPYSIKWAKYKTNIPYRVVQGSGDENALGVLKFNFPNNYSVYLHDTNQRYLFERKKRALSHGCVRVKAWKDLALYLLRNDSLKTGLGLSADTLQSLLDRKQKHYIPVRSKVPLFIRYFSCEGRDGKVVFYEDIYGEDRRLRDRFFNDK